MADLLTRHNRTFVGPTRYSSGGYLWRGKYQDNGTLALMLLNPREGEREMTVTVNLPNAVLDEDCVWVKDWSENEGIVDALVRAGVGRTTGRTWPTGFVEAVEFRVTLPLDKIPSYE